MRWKRLPVFAPAHVPSDPGGDEAYDIAARAFAAPGNRDEPLNVPIEVREVTCAPPA